MIARRRFLAISAAAALSGSASGARAAPRRWRGRALGAEVGITLDVNAERFDRLVSMVTAELRRMEKLFSLYDPGSDLSRLNRAGYLDRPPPEMVELLGAVGRLHRATGGRFDPTVQPLWAALARSGDVAAARRQIGWNRVAIGADRIRLGPGQALTLNGIAQGYATDRVAALLRAQGLVKVLVNIGEFSATGGPWRIGIEDPTHGLVAIRELRDTAIATSSPAAMILPDGRAHILDPLGGADRAHSSTISVQARNATLADGLSTALCLVPLAEAREILRRLPDVEQVICVDDSGAVAQI
ncbi:FAD:protein FMN transferase [Pukyongiella litopenaei]|uniref:FAD:protein FMN transferase n=1 Tax=Pukyongiella litopenaei TaxID=2605946 RepID=A0A2S0MQV9_9RHOB|nr:FAD:protein FMN transferase [Pukyongiella litopenaei]